MSNLSERENFIQAIEQGDIEKVCVLLTHSTVGINDSLHPSTGNPLMYAAQKGKNEICRLLIEKGANISSRSGLGKTPLILAATDGFTETSRLLLENGANINDKDDCIIVGQTVAEKQDIKLIQQFGNTPLILAALSGETETCRLLLERGANVNSTNKSGRTPLLNAAMNNYTQTCQLLLENGANLNDKDEHGQTAISLAGCWNRTETVELLEQHLEKNGTTSTIDLSHKGKQMEELRPSINECPSARGKKTLELAGNNILPQWSDEQEKHRYAEEQLSIKTIRITELETENQRLQEKADQSRQEADDLQRSVSEQRERINDLTNRTNEMQCKNRHLTDDRTLLQQNVDFLTQRIRDLEANIQLSSQRYCPPFDRQTPDWILNREEIIVSEQALDVSGWGSIKTGKFRGMLVAVKQMHQLILSPHNRELFEREMAIASQCRHPCLLQFIGATNDNGSPLFVTEMLKTDLRSLMSQRPLQEKEILRLCYDISCALNYLHMMHPAPIIYRGLSSSNILLWHEGKRLRAKISDYGATNFITDLMTPNPGTMLYSAPEAGTQQQTTKLDIYSFGVLLVEMCTGVMPIVQQREEQIKSVQNIELRNLIRRCTNQEAGLRPSAEELITFFEGRVNLHSELRKNLTFRAQIPSSGPVFSTGAMSRMPITLIRRCSKQYPRQRPSAEELIGFSEGQVNSHSARK